MFENGSEAGWRVWQHGIPQPITRKGDRSRALRLCQNIKVVIFQMVSVFLAIRITISVQVFTHWTDCRARRHVTGDRLCPGDA